MEIKQLQFLQQNIREVIRDIQADIEGTKAAKRIYDEQGLLELEYSMHNQLVQARKELAKWVALQKAVKREQREIHGFERIDNTLKAMFTSVFQGNGALE